jgi:hypothetical protein
MNGDWIEQPKHKTIIGGRERVQSIVERYLGLGE